MQTKSFFTTAALLFTLLLSSSSTAQEIIGFWGITEVKVGDEIMTPVAKWTKINQDQTFQNGNGWQQNSTGTWMYDRKDQTFQLQPTHGIGVEDEEGAFIVSFSDGKMRWEREEEGAKVVVSLERITQMPLSPADQLMGLWDLTSMTTDGKNTTKSFDPENLHYLHIRWDKIFTERTPQGERSMGYWFMRSHAPEITFISFNKERNHERWRVSIDGAELAMVGISDTNKGQEFRYTKINRFPE